MSGSPITSVPEPDSAGALASVITQVSQNAPAPILGRGPARPTKVAKSKKKSASAAAAATPASTSTSTQAAGSAAAQAVAAQTPAPVAGGPSTVPESQADTSAAPVVAPADGDKSLDSKVEHSNQPSSTVVDASDKEKEKTGPAAATSASEATPSTTTTPIAPAADAQQPPPPIAKTDPPPPPPKKAGAFSRILAVLTCSSSAGAMAAEDKADRSRRRSGEAKKSGEKRKTGGAGARAKPALAVAAGGATIGAAAAALGAEKKGGDLTPASKANGKLAPPPRTPTRRSIDASNGGSAPGTPILGSDTSLHGANTNVTPGGGTKIPREETGDVMSAAVVPPGSSFVSEEDMQNADGTYDDEDDEDEYDEDMEEDDEDASEEQRLIMQGGIGIPIDANGNPQPLLPELGTQDHGRKCLVLDLDETLVHSSFKAIQNADFIVPVEIEGTTHSVYVIKRPGVDEFMRLMGEIYEVVVFTASLSKYADPVLDILDIHRVVRHRLFRESCYNHKGNYVKDLSQLGRPIGDSIIIDNSPASYIFHPNNAVPVSSWFNDPHDTELTDLCPFLKDLSAVDDVRSVLDGGL